MWFYYGSIAVSWLSGVLPVLGCGYCLFEVSRGERIPMGSRVRAGLAAGTVAAAAHLAQVAGLTLISVANQSRGMSRLAGLLWFPVPLVGILFAAASWFILRHDASGRVRRIDIGSAMITVASSGLMLLVPFLGTA